MSFPEAFGRQLAREVVRLVLGEVIAGYLTARLIRELGRRMRDDERATLERLQNNVSAHL